MRNDRIKLAWVCVLCCACSDEALQRMSEQPKYRTYSQNVFFDDERAMRSPPAGTVPRERRPRDLQNLGGQRNGTYVDQIPIPITYSVLERGRRLFNVTCATCHGLVGDGNSVVAEKMSLRPPPSLHDFRDRPVGLFYQVITEGYGLMSGYAGEIRPEDRWAVVAYVRALQKSQHAPLREAPADVRAQLLKEPK